MNIIIPVGGQGIRFKNAGFKETKPLIPVFHKPMIQHLLDSLDTKKNKVFIFYHPDELETLAASNPNVIFVKIPRQTSGVVETVKTGIDEIGLDSFPFAKTMFFDCDTLYTQDLVEIFEKESQSQNMVFYRRDSNPLPMYSYIELDKDSQVIKIREKEKISDFANTGCYAFADVKQVYEYSKEVLDRKIVAKNGEPYISCIIDLMVVEKCPWIGYELDASRIFSLGTPAELEKYCKSRSVHLFDLDGTLVNTDSLYRRVWQNLVDECGIQVDITPEIYNTIIRGNDDRHVMQFLSIPEKFKSMVSEKKDELFVKFMDAELEIVPFAVEYIRYIRKETGNFVSVVTNCNRAAATAILEKMGIFDVVDFLVIGSECLHAKPYPDPYLEAMKRYKHAFLKTIVYEDSKSGLLSASSSNCSCIVAVESIYDHETLKQYGADVIVKDFKEYRSELFGAVTSYEKHSNVDLDLFKKWIRQSVTFGDDIESIEIDENKLKGGYISNILALEIHMKESKKVMHCVIKLENDKETSLSSMANNLSLYGLEYYFYNSIRNYVNVQAPKCYGIVKNDKLQNVGILLENLYKTRPCVPNLCLTKEPIETSFTIIKELSAFHARFWNLDLDKIFPNLLLQKRTFSRGEFVKQKWPEFSKKWSFLLTDRTKRLGEQIASEFSEIEERLSSHPNCTLIHGDVKSPNIFYLTDERKTPIFLDWQYCNIGKGVQDVAFFVLESFDLSAIEYVVPLLKNYYYVQLQERGVKNYSFEKFSKDWSDALRYFPFFVAMWFGTVPTDELIDKNFPFFFIQKLLAVYEIAA
jgi:beta-phosphoglucomutase-like phosphatase (HAD superfamily)/dTDP-glucose pyrophosphorylase